MNSPIDKSEIEKFRTPQEYLRWFDLILEHLQNHADETKALLHRKPYKKVYEEIFPIATLLKSKVNEWSEYKFRNVIG